MDTDHRPTHPKPSCNRNRPKAPIGIRLPQLRDLAAWKQQMSSERIQQLFSSAAADIWFRCVGIANEVMTEFMGQTESSATGVHTGDHRGAPAFNLDVRSIPFQLEREGKQAHSFHECLEVQQWT